MLRYMIVCCGGNYYPIAFKSVGPPASPTAPPTGAIAVPSVAPSATPQVGGLLQQKTFSDFLDEINLQIVQLIIGDNENINLMPKPRQQFRKQW
jgi:hypothetical protein